MSTTMNNKMLISGVPIAWVLSQTIGTGTNDDTVTSLWSFDNLSPDSSYKIMKPGSSSGTTTEKITVTRADGVTIETPKETLSLSLADETVASSSSTGTNGSGEGEITLVTNEAPTEVGFASPTSFIKDVVAKRDSTMLIVVPTGYTYNRLGILTAKKPDGFLYMWGMLTSDVEQKLTNGIITLSMTFAAQKSTFDGSAISFTGKGIKVKRGGGSNDIVETNNVPVALDSSDIALLNAGKIVMKVNS